ncbi:MAG: 3'-5' exonuclease [Victivallales bacterium]|nr:3'-5' exonuclease [Victivallales bacterium]
MEKPAPNQWYKLGPFTVFDLETTGMSPVYNRIVEIAGIRIETDGDLKYYSSIVNPNCYISKKISRIHNITNEMVVKYPAFDKVGLEFINFSEGSTLVAHNARFDLSFLQESLARQNLGTWGGRTMDTIPLIKQAYPGLKSYSLQYLKGVFGLDSDTGPAHRAFADVEWTMEIFTMTMKRLLNITI